MAEEETREDGTREEETQFEVGETVIIREDFHSKYFQGLRATIAGPPKKGGTSMPLWPVKLEVEPFETHIAGKYLRRPNEEEARPLLASADTGRNGTSEPNGESTRATEGKRSFLTRIIPWGRK